MPPIPLRSRPRCWCIRACWRTSSYNDFLDIADALLDELELAGVIQIASFHPQYRFEGTMKDAIENYTNRSPYPMLHLLRKTASRRPSPPIRTWPTSRRKTSDHEQAGHRGLAEIDGEEIAKPCHRNGAKDAKEGREGT